MTSSPGRRYMRKMFTVLPITFLFVPLFYAFLGYHPDMPVLFPVLVYVWHALFVFLGATLSFVFKKYRYLAYLAILAVAFFGRNIIYAPWLSFHKPVYLVEEGEMVAYAALETGELVYYAYIFFVSAFISGFSGILYSRKPALDFVQKNNTVLFCNVFALSALYYIFSGILENDKNSGFVFAAYVTGFAVSYFLVRSFAYINREIEVYGEMGAYSISEAKRVYSYYFSVLSLAAVVPVFVGIVVIPFVMGALETVISFFVALFFKALLMGNENQAGAAEPVIEPNSFVVTDSQGSGNEMLVYYIILASALAIILALIIIFRKRIIKALKELILFLAAKTNANAYGAGLIIDEEIITKAKKTKKSKPSYKDYLKKARKIKDLREAFFFSYSYVFWNTLKKDEELKPGSTPNELAERYEETLGPAELYQNIKYGKKPADNRETLIKMIMISEAFMQKFL